MKSIHSFPEEIMSGRPDMNHRFKAGAIGTLLVVALLAICFGSMTVKAQVLYGTLVGNVTDATGLNERYVSRIISSAFLAPEIVEAIVKGRQAPEVTLAALLDEVPLSWAEQNAKMAAFVTQ